MGFIISAQVISNLLFESLPHLWPIDPLKEEANVICTILLQIQIQNCSFFDVMDLLLVYMSNSDC